MTPYEEMVEAVTVAIHRAAGWDNNWSEATRCAIAAVAAIRPAVLEEAALVAFHHRAPYVGHQIRDLADKGRER
jgi:hypothetical protein